MVRAYKFTIIPRPYLITEYKFSGNPPDSH